MIRFRVAFSSSNIDTLAFGKSQDLNYRALNGLSVSRGNFQWRGVTVLVDPNDKRPAFVICRRIFHSMNVPLRRRHATSSRCIGSFRYWTAKRKPVNASKREANDFRGGSSRRRIPAIC